MWRVRMVSGLSPKFVPLSPLQGVDADGFGLQSVRRANGGRRKEERPDTRFVVRQITGGLFHFC